MVDLVAQCQMACDELIDATGRVAILVVLQMSAIEAAIGAPQQGRKRAGEVVCCGHWLRQVFLGERKLQVQRARLRTKGPFSHELEAQTYGERYVKRRCYEGRVAELSSSVGHAD